MTPSHIFEIKIWRPLTLGLFGVDALYFISVAACLFSDRSQMTSECGKNKNVVSEPGQRTAGDLVTDVLNTLTHS